MLDREELLRHLYERFNARDTEAVLAFLQEDVLWANGMEGGHVRGKEATRQYWTRQWALFNPHVEPANFSLAHEGQVLLDVHQVVRDLQGELISDTMVGHIFSFDGALVKRFDIQGAEDASAWRRT